MFPYQNLQPVLGAPGVQFPDGTVKKTWAHGFPREHDDIRIEEVLQKADLDLAVLSTYQLDADWITSKLEAKTKVIWILQAKTELERENLRAGAPKHFRFCFPSMSGNINCMHSKLQLLSHPTHLRIVVPSANLVAWVSEISVPRFPFLDSTMRCETCCLSSDMSHRS